MLAHQNPNLMSDFSLRYIHEHRIFDYRFDRCIPFGILALHCCKTVYTLPWCNEENIFESCNFDYNCLRYSSVYKYNYQRCNSAHKQCFDHYIPAYTVRSRLCKRHRQTQNLNNDKGKKKGITGISLNKSNVICNSRIHRAQSTNSQCRYIKLHKLLVLVNIRLSHSQVFYHHGAD